MKAYACPFGSTFLKFTDLKFINGRYYNTVGRSMQSSNHGSAAYWLCNFGHVTDLSVLVSLSVKWELTIVLASNEIMYVKS